MRFLILIAILVASIVAVGPACSRGDRTPGGGAPRVVSLHDVTTEIVVAFKGRVVISQGARQIAEVPVLASDHVAGRAETEWRYDFDVDPTSRSQQTLATTPVEDLRVVWTPERIDLEDGTILTVD